MNKLLRAVLFAVITGLVMSPAIEAGQQVPISLQEKAKKGDKLTKKERRILRSAGLIDKKGRWIGPRNVANPNRKPAQGSKVDQGTVLAGPTFKPCRGFEYKGEVTRPVLSRGNRFCPPGYGCRIQHNSAGFPERDCVWLNNVLPGARRPEHLPADHHSCKWDRCL